MSTMYLQVLFTISRGNRLATQALSPPLAIGLRSNSSAQKPATYPQELQLLSTAGMDLLSVMAARFVFREAEAIVVARTQNISLELNLVALLLCRHGCLSHQYSRVCVLCILHVWYNYWKHYIFHAYCTHLISLITIAKHNSEIMNNTCIFNGFRVSECLPHAMKMTRGVGMLSNPIMVHNFTEGTLEVVLTETSSIASLIFPS